MNRGVIALLPSVFLLTISCGGLINFISSFAERNQPPIWIEFIDDTLVNGNMVYVRIDDGSIWEQGDDVNTLSRQIADTLQVSIDGESLPHESVIILDGLSLPIYVHDDEGNEIGSYKDATHLYFKVPTVDGWHTAIIELTSTSGVLYAYSWSFQVPNRSQITP